MLRWMKSWNFWPSVGKPASKLLVLLALTPLVTGCFMATRTAGTVSVQIDEAGARAVCEYAWSPRSYSVNDTPVTIAEARQANAARAAFCKVGNTEVKFRGYNVKVILTP